MPTDPPLSFTADPADGDPAEAESVEAKPYVDPTSEALARLDRLAGTMDTRFSIPGTKIGVGLDALIGLIPVVGDAATVVPGVYIIHMGRRLGVRRRTTMRMTWNLALDWAVGLVPLVGDLLDVGFRSNTKNVELIRRDLAKRRIFRPR